MLHRAEIDAYGSVLLDNRDVTEIVENRQDDSAYRLNAGVYAVELQIFDALRAVDLRAGEQPLVDGLTELLAAGEPVRGVIRGALGRCDVPLGPTRGIG